MKNGNATRRRRGCAGSSGIIVHILLSAVVGSGGAEVMFMVIFDLHRSSQYKVAGKDTNIEEKDTSW